MKLTKISIEATGKKIKSREAKKIAQAKLGLKQKIQQKADALKTSKLLVEVSEKALDAAINGQSEAVIGMDYSSAFENIRTTLNEKSLHLKELPYPEYLNHQLRLFIDSQEKEKIQSVTEELASSGSKMKSLCEEIKQSYPGNYDDSMIYVIDLLNNTMDIQETLLERITSATLACSKISDVLAFIDNEELVEILEDEILWLTDVFSGTWAFQKIDEEAFVSFISWNHLSEKAFLNNEPIDDYFCSLGLGWLANEQGQLFISLLEKFIDKKIENDQATLKMHLYKFSSGYRVEFEENAEIYTLLTEVGFAHLFKKLGYKVNLTTSSADEVDIEISWKRSND